jgi:predicted CopG family antitoxin
MRVKDLSRKIISLRLETYDNLKSYGSLGDSFGDVIDNLIEFGKSKGMTQDVLKKVKYDRVHKRSASESTEPHNQ